MVDENLAAARFRTEACGEVRNGANGGIVEPPWESNSPARRISDRHADAEVELVPALSPFRHQGVRALAHLDSHADRLPRRVVDRHGVVEKHHHAIAGELFERATVFEDEWSQRPVILVEHRHHVLWLGCFRERGEAAHVAKHHRDLPAVALQKVIAAGQHDIRQLRWQEATQLVQPLDLAHLLRNACFELRVPCAKLRRLAGDSREQRLLLVVQPLFLDAGADSRLEQYRVERLRQVVFRALLDATYDALHLVQRGNHDHRDVAQRGDTAPLFEHRVAVHLRHHHVQQHEVDTLRSEHRQGLDAVRRFPRAVAKPSEPPDQHFAIGVVVIDDKDRVRVVFPIRGWRVPGSRGHRHRSAGRVPQPINERPQTCGRGNEPFDIGCLRRLRFRR